MRYLRCRLSYSCRFGLRLLISFPLYLAVIFDCGGRHWTSTLCVTLSFLSSYSPPRRYDHIVSPKLGHGLYYWSDDICVLSLGMTVSDFPRPFLNWHSLPRSSFPTKKAVQSSLPITPCHLYPACRRPVFPNPLILPTLQLICIGIPRCRVCG